MKYKELVSALDEFTPESRLRFSAYYFDRLVREAELHLIARAQLKNLPLIDETRKLLWARCENSMPPDPARLDIIAAHTNDYWVDDPSTGKRMFVFDPILSNVSLSMLKVVTILSQPDMRTGRYIAGLSELVSMTVSIVYEDYPSARLSEIAIRDEVVARLRSSELEKFSRAIFNGIPEWRRGSISRKYAMGHQSSDDDDDE